MSTSAKKSVNLGTLTLINRLMKKYANEINLKSSRTGYNQYGKGGGKRRLRFSKLGDRRLNIIMQHIISIKTYEKGTFLLE